MRIRALLLIISVVAVAGCTVPSGLFPGADVIKAVPSTQEEGLRDVLVVKDIGTIPKSSILAGQSVLLSFVIENLDKEKEAKDVVIDLFDAPLFKNNAGELCNNSPNTCVPLGCVKGSVCKIDAILPGEQKQVSFELAAPDDKAIANLKTELDLNFRVNYMFDGSTLLKLVVVNMDEIKARQRADSQITLDITKSVGSGPVKIDAELKGSNYMLSGMSGTFGFNVKTAGDPGKGGLMNSKIPAFLNTTSGLTSGLRIIFPVELVNKLDNLGEPSKFTCAFNAEKTEIACVNHEDIELIRGESTVMLFRITKSADIKVPFRSFDVKAFLKYTYELRDSVKMTIMPVSSI